MKRLLLPLMLLGLLASEAVAQKNFILSTLQHKGFVSVTTGYNMPACNTPFGKNMNDVLVNGQYAQTSAGYRFGRRLGVVGSYTYATNAAQPGAMLNTMGQSVDPAAWNTKATQCITQLVMVGPLLTIPTGRFLFDLQVTAGYAQSSSSRIELTSVNRNQPVSLMTPSRTAQALALGAGATVRYKLNRWLAVHSSLQYVTANMQYRDLTQEINLGNQHSVQPITPHQPMGFMNFGVGVSFLF